MAKNPVHRTPKERIREGYWQETWRARSVFRVPPKRDGHRDTYVLVSCPFTSGAAHIGHARSYSIADAYARFRRAAGDSVLFSIGYDAFGLPAEIRAIAESIEPRAWVTRSTTRMNEQFESLGFSFDWDRIFVSSDPAVYKWSQWLFLLLREAGLIARRRAPVDWCERCETTLSAGQAEGGVCWRCHEATTVVFAHQWFLDLSPLCDENFSRLEELDRWNKLALGTQASLLGRVAGLEADLVDERGRELTVFVEEEVEHANAIVMSPHHPNLDSWLDERTSGMVAANCLAHRRRGAPYDSVDAYVETTHRLGAPGGEATVPLLISSEVDSRYGPNAVLVDRRAGAGAGAGAEAGISLSTLAVRPTTRYRVAPFPISRQRCWGAPIPMVHCPACGLSPVSKAELPICLPEEMPAARGGNVLAEMPDFWRCRCPRCGGEARRETDTLDCHFDATWQQVPLAVPPEDRSERMFDHPELSRWFPISRYVQGADIGGFVLDERAVSKLLRDLGHAPYLPDGEPYEGALMHGMVKLDGQKMSKHLSNSVDPDQLVSRYGADAVRFGLLHAAAPSRDFSWSDAVVQNAEQFLSRAIAYAEPRLLADSEAKSLHLDGGSKRRRQLLRWCAIGRDRITDGYEKLEMHTVARALMTLFSRIEDFGARTTGEHDPASQNPKAEAAALLLFVQLLAPIAPHTAEQLWQLSGREGLVTEMPWPAPVAGEDLQQVS
jgi:leucyl-tRNA synthetase